VLQGDTNVGTGTLAIDLTAFVGEANALAEFDPGAFERTSHQGERRPIGRALVALECAHREDAQASGASEILLRPSENVASGPGLGGGQRHRAVIKLRLAIKIA